MNLFKVYSDNFNGELMNFATYKEVRLQMSTGDFHTHKVITVINASPEQIELALDLEVAMIEGNEHEAE